MLCKSIGWFLLWQLRCLMSQLQFDLLLSLLQTTLCKVRFGSFHFPHNESIHIATTFPYEYEIAKV